jgi:hypothetical protein
MNDVTLIALFGRRDYPTDGVEDYCTYLGKALKERGVALQLVRVPWAEEDGFMPYIDSGRKQGLGRTMNVCSIPSFIMVTSRLPTDLPLMLKILHGSFIYNNTSRYFRAIIGYFY